MQNGEHIADTRWDNEPIVSESCRLPIEEHERCQDTSGSDEHQMHDNCDEHHYRCSERLLRLATIAGLMALVFQLTADQSTDLIRTTVSPTADAAAAAVPASCLIADREMQAIRAPNEQLLSAVLHELI